ncbi:MAG: DUF4058 family protein [Pirellulales bacterium]|nr:DUF4058 family protein [Pirellulales bacterium]
MPSPFPGMDPYLESHWGDIHHALINYARDAIQPRLPGDLYARMEERVYVESPQELAARYLDVRVVEGNPVGGVAVATETVVAVAEPYVLEILAEPVTEGFIEIREPGSGDRVITVIEVLSPANKEPGEGRRQYRRKQRELQRGRVNLVEIDLLRAGRWTVLAARDWLPERLREPYHISVFRSWRPLSLEFYHAPLRQRLPAIRVPLRQGDPDVALDIQALTDRSYQFGRYERTDYARDPKPPLTGDDAVWADALLREKGLRE